MKLRIDKHFEEKHWQERSTFLTAISAVLVTFLQTSLLHYQILLNYQELYNRQLFLLRHYQKSAVLFEKDAL